MRRRGFVVLLGTVAGFIGPVPVAAPGAAAKCVPVHRAAVTPRDRHTLSPAQVRALLDDLRRALLARYGVPDDVAFEAAHRLGARIVIPVRFHVITDGRTAG